MINKTEKEIMKNWKYYIKKPIVSISCAVYNHEKFISDALDGFLSQETKFPFEIVIGEDCSTDSTKSIILKYYNKFPNILKPIYWKKNVGASKNWQTILEKCCGKYIANCEGDDYWIDNLKLQKQVDFLDVNLDYGLVCTDMIRYNQKDKTYLASNIIPLGQSLSKSEKIDQGHVYEELIDWKSQVWSLTVCFRKNLLVDLPVLDSSTYFTGDRLLFIHASLKSKIKYFKEKTAVYRVLEESASHFRDPVRPLEFLYMLSNLMLYFLKNHPVNTKLHERVLYKYMFIKFQYSIASRDYNIFKAVKLFLPSNPSIKMITCKVLYLLCKSKAFFRILSFLYKRRILAPYKKINLD